MNREPTPTILVSADPSLIHLVQASAAAAGVYVVVVSDVRSLASAWRSAPAVLIGHDQAEQVVGSGLPQREQVYLIGRGQCHEALCQWSMPLGASVIILPAGGKWLTRVVAGQAGASSSAAIVTVRGGAGGLGASTLCAGLAMLAARRMRVALVDGDPHGGGIDLLLGAEDKPGWRWDKLRQASGQIADVVPMLPHVEGVTLVSMERVNPAPVPDAALESVVDCLGRSHDVVFIDQGRTASAPASPLGRCLVLSALTVRGIAATRARSEENQPGDCGLVLRKPGSVAPADAARVLGLPLVGLIPNVPDLARLADRGIPPAPGGAWKQACSTVLRWCVREPGETGRRRPW